MAKGYKRIKILSEAEISDLYSLPKFTPEERIIFFALNSKERRFIETTVDIPSKVHAILQLGYFKAKGYLFSFGYKDVLPDLHYVLTKYFTTSDNHKSILLKARKEENNKKILTLLNFRSFNDKIRKELVEQALLLASIHANHLDIFRELLSYIQTKQIILPDYTVLQDIISLAVGIELRRVNNILQDMIPKDFDSFLSDMIKHDVAGTINLQALKEQPKNFKHMELKSESGKATLYSEAYGHSKVIIGKLGISPKAIRYYARLADEYNTYKLEQLAKPMRNLYLLCYINQRYRQINDNLVAGFIYYNNNFMQEASEYSNKQLALHAAQYHGILPRVSNLLRFMGTDAQQMAHEAFWNTAHNILPKTQYLPTADYIEGQSFDLEFAKWEFYVNRAKRIKANLRLLFKSIEFSCSKQDNELMEAVLFLKDTFDKKASLKREAADKLPDKFIPRHIRKYLYVQGKDEAVANNNIYHPDKYEFYLYQSVVRAIDKGSIFCSESTKYKSLSSDLVSNEIWQNKKELIQKLNYPNIAVDINQRLDELETKLHAKTLEINKRIAGKKNSFIKIKNKEGKGQDKDGNSWYLTDSSSDKDDKLSDNFFSKTANIHIGQLLHFINKQTDFCKAFNHIRPRYSKQNADYEEIIACIVANGLGFGIYKMAQSCDISYSTLSNAEKNFLSLENLREANDIISNKIADLKVFNLWNIMTDKLLAGIDGQKFETRLETIQARYSPKYFGLNKGIVAFSMVLNHVPVNCKIIGANEHESHYTYDIIYNNTSDLDPDAISGDTHSINKVNFATLDSIGKLFMPNFTSPEEQAKSLKSIKPLNLYKDCFIKPTKLINKKLIIDEWDNIQRIFVSLATQESTQSTIISKLSSHKRYSRIKAALWEYDSILKSIYLLDFIDDNILRSQIRKALNRVEAYHQLRRAIAKVHSGKFRGRTILENEVWNQCSRLLSNSIILYNAIILDKLLEQLKAQGDTKGIDFLNSISPVRWQHVNFIGKYDFTQAEETVKMENIVSQLHNHLKTVL